MAAGEDPLDGDDNVRPLEELEAAVDDDADEQMRYVMIDDQMAGGKFSAMTAWSGPDYDHYVTPDVEAGEEIDRDEVDDSLEVPYEDTMVAGLYFDDAAGMDNYRLVHENDQRTAGFVSYALIDPETDQVLTDETGQHQVAINQPLDQQTEIQLSQFEQSPDVDVEYIDEREGAAVKTYERVEGATIVGTAPDADEGDAVTAELELDSGVDRDSFTYEQEAEVDENGEFELTVPYATDDELDVEDGYTESAVEAVDEYTVTVEGETPQQGDIEVPESAVVDGEIVEVDLEETALEADDAAADDETDGTENGADDAGDTADEDDDTGAEADDGEDADDTAGSLVPTAAGLAD